MKRQLKEKTWTTAQGKTIPLSKLKSDHLLNILRHLERRKHFQDIGARMVIDSRFNDPVLFDLYKRAERMEMESVAERFAIYPDLVLLARKRNLI